MYEVGVQQFQDQDSEIQIGVEGLNHFSTDRKVQHQVTLI
jgi:hypothetical protein